jgi:hypothetical protein
MEAPSALNIVTALRPKYLSKYLFAKKQLGINSLLGEITASRSVVGQHN